MFGRRKDIQIPKTPNTSDKATQNWMAAVGSMLNKYIGGGTDDRLVSAKELIDGGIAGVGTGGFLTPPTQNLTKPPKVTGLTANGALASIIVQWVNPVFVNYAYTELWRADVDDVGQAFLIARTQVESYIDNVGSAATKYYWARAVSNSGVKGEFNGAAGVKGQTSYDPEYVKGLLTASKWKANTAYAPYQYVQPTTENGFQYMVVDGGISGGTEPTWPVVVNDVANDATVQWVTISDTARLPFVIGTQPNGDPAVFIDTAFIKDATITSAKIGNLVADKITTGDLNADLHVLQKLWYGFDEFSNAGQEGGFWLGVEGGVPKFKVDTGLAHGNKHFTFDGINLSMNFDVVNSADGYFDDLQGDSVSFARAGFEFLSFGEQVTASQYVFDEGINISEPEFNQYLCYPNGCQKTETWQSANLVLGSGYSRPFAFFQTSEYISIKPYDYRSADTRYRANKQNIGFSVLVNTPFNFGSVGNYYGGHYLDIYILSESQSLPAANYNDNSVTAGIPSQYLLKIPVTNHSGGSVTAYRNTGSGDVAAFYVDVVIDTETNPRQTLIVCDDDEGFLGYVGSRKLKVAVVYKAYFQAGGSDDGTLSGILTVSMQMRSIAGDENIPQNDNTLSITATAANAQQYLSLNALEERTLRKMIRERINQRDPL